MRRTPAAIAAALLATSLIATTDGAEELPPEPVEYTFHLHGSQTVDEAGHGILDPFPAMDLTAPTEATPKSKQMLNYVGGPNTQCSGNNLFPTWQGFVDGIVSGPVTLSLPMIGNGDDVEVRVFKDTAQQCNEAYVSPIGSAIAASPSGPGTLEVTIPVPAQGANVAYALIVMVVPAEPTAQARALYDSTDYDATLTFTCTGEDKPGVEGEVCKIV